MKRLIIFIMCALLMCQFNLVDAQSRNRSKQSSRQTSKVYNKKGKKKAGNKKRGQTDTSKKNFREKNKIPETCLPSSPVADQQQPVYSDPLIVDNVIEGYSIGNKLYLMTNEHYLQLSESQRRDLINLLMRDNNVDDVIVTATTGEQEWWSTSSGTPQRLEQWNETALDLVPYAPLELQTSGETRVFYSIGGLFNYCDNTFNSTLTLQAGTYLYKNLLDLSMTLNLGYNKSKDSDGQFMGNVGLSSRVYLPFRLNSIHLAPYVGGGVAWTFYPSSTIEPRALAGVCWFVGPGSLDLGAQWGKTSKFSFTFGYTFRPHFRKKTK